MSNTFGWSNETWRDVLIPLAVFGAGVLATLWLRRIAYNRLERWAKRTKWQGDEILLQVTKVSSILWCLLLSASLALAVSKVPERWENPSRDGLWTLLLLSITLSTLSLASKLITFYGERLQASQRAIRLSNTITSAIIYVIAILILLDIWGAPVGIVLPVILFFALVIILVFRETLINLVSGVQLNALKNIKEGDYIKLETGEEGYISKIDWTTTQINVMGKSTVLVPNSKLLRSTVINYGQAMKKAKEPFRFFDRAHLKELTGYKAKNLRELANILKNAPPPVVYYHTHQFLEEQPYFAPEPANDFAVWVTDTLGNELLGEKLASVDAFELLTPEALRTKLVGIIEENLSACLDTRESLPGGEFHFMKSVSVILPTQYEAHDLREFLETLRKISLSSLHLHIFEPRLRLGEATNDFSIWLENSLDEKELADKIARFDPYSYTLEVTRSRLIQLLEKHIQ